MSTTRPRLRVEVTARCNLVLVVDPVAASRLTMWRWLSRSFAVLEAPDARRARDWLASRPTIDAMVVQEDLPDGRGRTLVRSLARAGVAAASRAILVDSPVMLPEVVAKLTEWFVPTGRARIRGSDGLRR